MGATVCRYRAVAIDVMTPIQHATMMTILLRKTRLFKYTNHLPVNRTLVLASKIDRSKLVVRSVSS